jgi:ankyrin repeat protein
MRFLAPFLVLLLGGCGRPPTTGFLGAVRTGDLNALAGYIQSGADLNRREGVNDWTPLMHAIHKNQQGSVRLLLNAGADPNRAAPDGMTPLMMAAGYGYEGIVRDLLEHGANPRLRHRDGSTALDLAVVGTTDIDRVTVGDCQTGTVKVLLDKAPDLRLNGNGLDRAAIWVKSGTCRPMMQLLKERKAL